MLRRFSLCVLTTLLSVDVMAQALPTNSATLMELSATTTPASPKQGDHITVTTHFHYQVQAQGLAQGLVPNYQFWAVSVPLIWTTPCGDFSTKDSCTFSLNRSGVYEIAISAKIQGMPSETTIHREGIQIQVGLGTIGPIDPRVVPVMPELTPALRTRLRNILARGIEAGNDPKVFAKIGDSITESASFLGDVGCNWIDYGRYALLQETVKYFSEKTISGAANKMSCGAPNSFNAISLSAAPDWKASDALATTKDCSVPNNTAFRCELFRKRPSIAIIMYGTNDVQSTKLATFGAHMRRIVGETIELGVIPLLSTIPPRNDSFALQVDSFNRELILIAQEFQVPMMNYNRAMNDLGTANNLGVSTDRIHPSICNQSDGAVFTDECLRFGYNVRNLSSLQALDLLRKEILQKSSDIEPPSPLIVPTQTATPTPSGVATTAPSPRASPTVAASPRPSLTPATAPSPLASPSPRPAVTPNPSPSPLVEPSPSAIPGLSVSRCPNGFLPAFAGAEGFGACTTSGARSATAEVVEVTNLERSGPGSFQAAVIPDSTGNSSRPRYVVFRVSGLIPANILVRRSNLYIAGHTSPYGIIVRGIRCDNRYDSVGHCENVIMRGIRSRVSSEERGTVGGTIRPATIAVGAGAYWDDTESMGRDDAFRIQMTNRIVVDHSSFSGSEDELMQGSESNNVTVMNSVFAEPIGGHFVHGGMLLNYSDPSSRQDRYSIIKNAWVGLGGRLPEITCESPSCAGHVMNLELSNNVVYDQRIEIWYNACPEGGSYCLDTSYNQSRVFSVNMNWINNLMVAQSYYDRGGIERSMGVNRYNNLFFSGNTQRIQSISGATPLRTQNDYDLMGSASGAVRRTARHAFPEVNYIPQPELSDYVQANAGPFPRDPMMTRVLGYLSRNVNDADVTPNAPNLGYDEVVGRDVGDGLRLATATGPLPYIPASSPSSTLQAGTSVDTDHDGMPDDWERCRGLSVGTQDQNGTQLSGGTYSNLEIYLNDLMEIRSGTMTGALLRLTSCGR